MDEQTRTVKDFFRGIKKCWLPALLIGILFGMTLLLVVFSLGFFDAYHLSTALKVVSITFSIILLVFMILFTSFFLTQTAAFKMKGTVLIRNSVLFVLGTNIQAILFIGIAIAPVFLVLVPGITMLLVMLFGFVGFSYTSLVITLYCHHCYEKLLYDKVSGKPTAKYAKRSDDDGDDKTKKKTKTAQYKEPKKRKRSIDEGSDITPLTPTFRREDLERLQKEHEQVMLESEEVEIDEDSDEKAGAPDKAAVEAAASETAPEEKAGESRPAQNKADKKPQKSGGKGKKG